MFYMAVTEELVSRVSTLVNVLQALGIAILIYVIFGIINAIINRKRLKELEDINKNIKDLKKIMSKKK